MLTSDLSFASNQYKDYAEKCFQGWLTPNSTSVCKDLFMQALTVSLHAGGQKNPSQILSLSSLAPPICVL